ncbi:unnamed protein product [Phaedon cochleariae]|uniref:Borealin C-terminal domain-containing protein n=1 Tax=Phaedon cochleariae TaxID=80249 RepID=A0A9P0DLZ4_PHACE|nr:unnamed protein product [Phaedon cochleariae]
MPRTKVSRKVITKPDNDVEIKQIKLKCQKLIENKVKKALIPITKKEYHDHVNHDLIEERMNVPTKCLKLSMTEMKRIASFKSYETTSAMSYIVKEDAMKLANSTKSNRNIYKSSSSTDDGYLTTESSSSRYSRSTTKGPRSTRATRSLSRSNHKNSVKPTSVMKHSEMETPANKRTPPNSYGTITPKCKPNTPLVILRRPKMGETALSMQGSPLLTSSIATEEQANINIPLGDGTMLSLLPQKGLRMSQIPQFDSNTLKQLSSLSENLKKVVEVTEKKYGLNFD